MSKGLKLYVLAYRTVVCVDKIESIKDILPTRQQIIDHVMSQQKEKIIRVRITADVAEKLQQVGNVSAYIRSALIAKMENEKLIKIKIPF